MWLWNNFYVTLASRLTPKAKSMYLPAHVSKHLTTPEARSFEMERRRLKATLASALEAVKNCNRPIAPLDHMTRREYEYYTRKHLPSPMRWAIGDTAVAARQAAEYEAYHLACIDVVVKRKALKDAALAARAAYDAHITRSALPPSDLE